jgi:hypothetical protein
MNVISRVYNSSFMSQNKYKFMPYILSLILASCSSLVIAASHSTTANASALKHQLDNASSSSITRFLEKYYPQGSSIKPLLAAFSQAGAQVTKQVVKYKKDYDGKSNKFTKLNPDGSKPVYDIYIIKYLDTDLSWWQSQIRGMQAQLVKLIFRVNQLDNRINYHIFFSLPWESTSDNTVVEHYYRGCCYVSEVIPLYAQLNLNDYDSASAVREALLYFFPVGTSAQLANQQLLAAHPQDFFTRLDNNLANTEYFYLYKKTYVLPILFEKFGFGIEYDSNNFLITSIDVAEQSADLMFFP